MHAPPTLDPRTALAVAAADQGFAEIVNGLERLVRIPSCSFPGFDPRHIEESAAATSTWLRDAGFPSVEILRLPGVFPYVLAKDHRAGASAPTVVLYAHHDVQPPLREEAWRTPPFIPTRRGERLYGRGAADDKGGIAVHVASAQAWNRTLGHPPVNLTVVIEGEEEIGSHHFPEFLRRHRDQLTGDCLIIADLQNFDTGLPSLTTSLRGLVVIECQTTALRAPVHSGIWGGAVPDPTLALCRILASLTDADGRLTVPGLQSQVREPTALELEAFVRLPYVRARVAEQAGMQEAALPPDGATLYRRMWREPALSINVLQAGTRGQTGNVVMDGAWARIGIRIVPDMEPQRTYDLVAAHLQSGLPPGVSLTTTPTALGSPWATTPDHPLFALARSALHCGYGQEAVFMGCGASIPFVQEMSATLGNIPALLLGVEDPECGAHSENESVHLGDLRSTIRAQTAFFGLLAAHPEMARATARGV